MLLGGTRAFNGKPPVGWATAWLLVIVATVVVVAALLRVLAIRPRKLLRRRGRLLLASGAAAMAAVVLYTTLGLGYGAEYSGAPLMATMPGLVAFLAGLSEMVVPADTVIARRIASVMVLIGVCALVPFNVYRMQAGRFDAMGSAAVADASRASVRIADLAQGRPVAVYWLQDFSAFHMNYYLTQAGRAPLLRIENQDSRLAISRPIPAGESPQAWLERLRTETASRAAVIVVNENTRRYADPGMPSGLFREGEPIIRSLLDDPQFEAVEHFQVGPNRFVVLARRATS